MAGIRLLAEYRQDSPGSSSSNRNGSFRFEKDVSPESSSSDQRELRHIPANKDAAAAPIGSPGKGRGTDMKEIIVHEKQEKSNKPKFNLSI